MPFDDQRVYDELRGTTEGTISAFDTTALQKNRHLLRWGKLGAYPPDCLTKLISAFLSAFYLFRALIVRFPKRILLIRLSRDKSLSCKIAWRWYKFHVGEIIVLWLGIIRATRLDIALLLPIAFYSFLLYQNLALPFDLSEPKWKCIWRRRLWFKCEMTKP